MVGVCGWPALRAPAAQVIRVDSAALPGGDGLTWGTAISDLSAALALAAGSPPCQVWVAQGTYRPDGGSGNRELSFTVAAGVGVYGGFSGVETDISQRDPATHITLLSGDIGQPNIPDDNSRHVVVVPASGNPATVIDGVVIAGGNANGASFPQDSGGGILIDGGSPTVRDCVVRTCAGKYGGGIFTRGGSPAILDCTLAQNVASADGGGMNANGSIVLSGCWFDANRAGFGGGMVICCGNSRVTDCRFTGNFAGTGGGLFSPVGTLAVVRCAFEANSAGSGGGINSSSASSTMSILASSFTGNAATQGGGLYLTNAPLLFDCIVSKNTGMQRGAGLYLQGGAKVINCTLFSNWSLTQGGGIYAASGIPTLANSILWSNADTQASAQASQLSSASGQWNVNYCCVQGWTGSIPGIGNTASPPLFAAPAGADQRLGTADDSFLLLPGSSCIDAGDALLVPLDQWDLDGDGDLSERSPLDYAGATRMIDDPEAPNVGPGAPPHVDIGAYERQAFCRADFDGSGWVDVDDYSAFVQAFEAGLDSADYDHSGFVDVEDFNTFVQNFEGGC